MPVDDGRTMFDFRKPKRLLRFDAPVKSFFAGDKRGVERPIFRSFNASIVSTETEREKKKCKIKFPSQLELSVGSSTCISIVIVDKLQFIAIIIIQRLCRMIILCVTLFSFPTFYTLFLCRSCLLLEAKGHCRTFGFQRCRTFFAFWLTLLKWKIKKNGSFNFYCCTFAQFINRCVKIHSVQCYWTHQTKHYFPSNEQENR